MAQQRTYKRFSGKVIQEIDSSVTPSGEVFIGIKFRDNTELTFAVSQRPVLEAFRAAPGGKKRRKRLQVEWRSESAMAQSA
jgi:hypothetical protein